MLRSTRKLISSTTTNSRSSTIQKQHHNDTKCHTGIYSSNSNVFHLPRIVYCNWYTTIINNNESYLQQHKRLFVPTVVTTTTTTMTTNRLLLLFPTKYNNNIHIQRLLHQQQQQQQLRQVPNTNKVFSSSLNTISSSTSTNTTTLTKNMSSNSFIPTFPTTTTIQQKQLIQKLILARTNIYKSIRNIILSFVFGIPFIALCQGVYLLSEFRKNHGSAPRPMIPSRGMVVVTDNDSDEDVHYYYYGNTTTDTSSSSTFDDDNENGENDDNSTGSQATPLHHPSKKADMTTVSHSSSFSVDENAISNATVKGEEQEQEHKQQLKYQLKKRRNSDMKQKQRSKPPLRLLVIGDSLAAGVGISGSSTPVLPESIAVSLSKAMHGRPVYWVCTGVPGYTSSQIVQEIYNLDTTTTTTTTTTISDTNTNESTTALHNNSQQQVQQQLPQTENDLMRRLQEWQYEMKIRAQERLDISRQKASDWLEQRSNRISTSSTSSAVEEETSKINTDNNTQSLEQQQQHQRNFIIRWYNRRRIDFTQKVDTIKDRVITIIRPKRSNTKKILDHSMNSTSSIDTETDTIQVHRRATIDRHVVGKYDIAVVLTGLNDLKESALPFMFDKTPTTSTNNNNNNGSTTVASSDQLQKGGLVNEFIRITEALREKMKDTVNPIIKNYKSKTPSLSSQLETLSSSSSSSDVVVDIDADNNTAMSNSNSSIVIDSNTTVSNDDECRNPIVVFPALPVVPCPLTEWAPLCWFVVPFLRGIDQQKEALASLYPGLVLYVESPNFQEIFRAINGKKKVSTTNNNNTLIVEETSSKAALATTSSSAAAALWNSNTGERIHLKLTDITQQAKDRILEAMHKHYGTWKKDSTNDSNGNETNDLVNINKSSNTSPVVVNYEKQQEPQQQRYHQEDPEPYELDYFGDNRNTAIATSAADAAVASSIVAIDGIHPNDDGYDIWGRHIANKIVKELQRRSEL